MSPTFRSEKAIVLPSPLTLVEPSVLKVQELLPCFTVKVCAVESMSVMSPFARWYFVVSLVVEVVAVESVGGAVVVVVVLVAE